MIQFIQLSCRLDLVKMFVFNTFGVYCKRTIQVLCVLTAIVLSACEQPDEVSPVSLLLPDAADGPDRSREKPVSLLEKIKQRGKLTVLTTNLPTTYYYDRDNKLAGPEYEMTQSFAESLQVDVEYKVYDSTKKVIDALRKNEGDIAAAGLTVNQDRKSEFDFGPVYQGVYEYLVCHRSTVIT